MVIKTLIKIVTWTGVSLGGSKVVSLRAHMEINKKEILVAKPITIQVTR